MLVINKLTKKYNKVLFNNLSFTFKENTITSILGESGSGKSTLLKILAGNIVLYSGEVLYLGNNIKKIKNYTYNYISYMSQSAPLLLNKTVKENILLPLLIKKEDEKDYEIKLLALLNYFSLKEKINNKVKDLSGGEKQRISIIKTLMSPNKILLFDEPTSALDENNALKFLAYLKEIKKDKIIIIVTHNEHLASLCDEAIDFSLMHEKINNNIVFPLKENNYKINYQYILKNVLVNKKIFSIFINSLLTISSITILLCGLLKSFINEIVSESFSSLNTENLLTFKAKKSEEIDFSKLDSKYEYIYYEGLEPIFKSALKANNQIEYADFNGYDIKDSTIIYDNYLSFYEENITLAIPSGAKENISVNNYINFYFLNKSYKIPIDKIVTSEDDSFYLYANNINYLYSFLKDMNLTLKTSSFLYGKQSKLLYEELNSNPLYSHYLFNYDATSKVIEIIKNDYIRIANDYINELKESYQYNNCIFADYIHTFIDYETGFSYLILADNSYLQVLIDNSLADNTINISNAYSSSFKHGNSLKILDKVFKINKITNENNYEIIYMNAYTYNLFNEDIYYVGLYLNKDDTFILNDKLLTNSALFSLNNFDVFSSIFSFLNFFSCLSLLLSFLAFFIIFNYNFFKKEKEINNLLTLGINHLDLILLILFDPLSSFVFSLASSLFSYFAIKRILISLYYKFYGISLSLNVSLKSFLILIITYLISLFIILIIKLFIFFKNKSVKC